MRPRFIVIVDPASDPGPGLGTGHEGFEIDALLFERAPQPLDENVVQVTALAVEHVEGREERGRAVALVVVGLANALMAGASGSVPGGRLMSRKRPSTPASRYNVLASAKPSAWRCSCAA